MDFITKFLCENWDTEAIWKTSKVALYPQGCNETRLLDAMLLVLPK